MAYTRWIIHAVLLISAVPLAHAQIPGTLQPGQIERQFQKPPEPKAQPGVIQVPVPSEKPPANAADIKFVLTRLNVDGATIYAADSLRTHYANLLGKEITLADIYRVAGSITARYRNDGYILSQAIVPAQTVDDGVVRLQMVEGYVASVRVEGSSPGVRTNVTDHADKIKAAKPLTSAALERYLLLINDLPGVTARAVLTPSKTQTGASELVVQISEPMFGGGLSIDNRGSRALGPRRLMGDIEAFYPLGYGARTGFKFVTTGNGELAYYALSQDQWLGTEGSKLSLNLSASRSKPEELAFIPLNLETASHTGALTFSHPVLRSREQNLYLRGTLSAHNGETKIFGVRDTEDHVRTLRVGMTYDLADALAGINTVDMEYSRGFRGMGSSRNNDPMLSRPNGRVDFSKVALYAARLQSLGGNWSALAAFNGQYAFTNLLSSELFSFGGEQFGRGYDPSELVGDHGAALKFEMRYSGKVSDASYTTYGFYDVGQVRQRNSGGLSATTSAASTGLGLRLGMGRHLSGVVEFAKPLTKIVSQENDRKLRFYAGLSVRF